MTTLPEKSKSNKWTIIGISLAVIFLLCQCFILALYNNVSQAVVRGYYMEIGLLPAFWYVGWINRVKADTLHQEMVDDDNRILDSSLWLTGIIIATVMITIAIGNFGWFAVGILLLLGLSSIWWYRKDTARLRSWCRALGEMPAKLWVYRTFYVLFSLLAWPLLILSTLLFKVTFFLRGYANPTITHSENRVTSPEFNSIAPKPKPVYIAQAPVYESYYGLSLAGGGVIKYNGPLNKLELEGSNIPDFVRQVLAETPSAHCVIIPQMGLVILVKSSNNFLAFQFSSALSKSEAAIFMSSVIASGNLKVIEKYGAIELNGPYQVSSSNPEPAQTEKKYSGYSKAVIYCRAGFNLSTLHLPGFTGNAEVIRGGDVVDETEIVAAMLLKGCEKDCILLSSPDYGVGFIK